jgi:hypothetical protein
MLPTATVPAMMGLIMWTSLAWAQGTVGELLDAGARKLSVDEFKQELLQRLIVGPSPIRGTLEVIYASSGVIQGIATAPSAPNIAREVQIVGAWTTGENGTVCTSMRISSQPGGSVGGMAGWLPPRCQVWFKLGEKYFVSDSDDDRSAKVLSRTIKQ